MGIVLEHRQQQQQMRQVRPQAGLSNLPHPDSHLAIENELATADLSEIVRLYGLKMWVELSYKQELLLVRRRPGGR
mgnify:CR=1 FL=1